MTSDDDWSAPTVYGGGRSPATEPPGAQGPDAAEAAQAAQAAEAGSAHEPAARAGGGNAGVGGGDARARARPAADDARAAVHNALATGYHPYLADPVGLGGAAGADGWSAAVVHHGGAPSAGKQVTWSPVTYAGKRRYRPDGTRTDGPPTDGTRTDGHAPADPVPSDWAGPTSQPPLDADLLEADLLEADLLDADLLDADLPARPAPGAEAHEAHQTHQVATAARSDAQPGIDHSLLASSRTMAVASLVSRLTGLLRTAAIAAAVGSAAVGVADPYNVANSLPNMVYELLVGGVLSSVLIPLIVFAQEHDPDRGVAYTQRLLSIATATLGAATLLAVLAAPLITDVVVGAGSKRELTTILATLLLPEIFFYGIGALIMAVLNSRNVYGPPAWAPVLNNVIVIAALGLFALLPGGTPTIGSITDLQILVLGVGTTLGIAAQAVVLVPSLRRSGFVWRWRFRPTSPTENGRLREVRTLGLWVLGYVAASQVGVVVIQRVGTARPLGYTTFTNADLLFQVPYGILGVSLLTALMPRMSRAAANNDLRAVVADLGLGARLSAVALVPITVGLIVLGPSLTSTILLGRFRAPAAHEVGVALAWGAFGLLPFAVVMLQMRVFYAMRDARTPTLINLGMVSSKVLLIGIATAVFGSDVTVVRALVVSTSLSYVVGAAVGHVLLQRRLGSLGFRAVANTVARIGLASIAGGVVAWLVVRGVNTVLSGPRVSAVVGLVLGAALGGAVMAVAAWRLRLPELTDIMAAVRPGRNTDPAAVVDPPGGATPTDPPTTSHRSEDLE